MTTNYKESALAGTAWNRCHTIAVMNPRGFPPAIQFLEERVIALDDGQEIRQNLGPIDVIYDPDRIIPLLDPTTGESTGQVATYSQVYQILYSAYISAAQARDASMARPDVTMSNEPITN